MFQNIKNLLTRKKLIKIIKDTVLTSYLEVITHSNNCTYISDIHKLWDLLYTSLRWEQLASWCKFWDFHDIDVSGWGLLSCDTI